MEKGGDSIYLLMLAGSLPLIKDNRLILHCPIGALPGYYNTGLAGWSLRHSSIKPFTRNSWIAVMSKMQRISVSDGKYDRSRWQKISDQSNVSWFIRRNGFVCRS